MLAKRLSSFVRFAREERGATSVEYALIAAIICLGIVTSITPITNALRNHFGNVSEGLKR
jgi:pilus assembly protein Flp/PilA